MEAEPIFVLRIPQYAHKGGVLHFFACDSEDRRCAIVRNVRLVIQASQVPDAEVSPVFRPGNSVVALIPNYDWCRCTVIAISPDTTRAKVFLHDHGVLKIAPFSDMRHTHSLPHEVQTQLIALESGSHLYGLEGLLVEKEDLSKDEQKLVEKVLKGQKLKGVVTREDTLDDGMPVRYIQLQSSNGRVEEILSAFGFGKLQGLVPTGVQPLTCNIPSLGRRAVMPISSEIRPFGCTANGESPLGIYPSSALPHEDYIGLRPKTPLRFEPPGLFFEDLPFIKAPLIRPDDYQNLKISFDWDIESAASIVSENSQLPPTPDSFCSSDPVDPDSFLPAVDLLKPVFELAHSKDQIDSSEPEMGPRFTSQEVGRHDPENAPSSSSQGISVEVGKRGAGDRPYFQGGLTEGVRSKSWVDVLSESLTGLNEVPDDRVVEVGRYSPSCTALQPQTSADLILIGSDKSRSNYLATLVREEPGAVKDYTLTADVSPRLHADISQALAKGCPKAPRDGNFVVSRNEANCQSIPSTSQNNIIRKDSHCIQKSYFGSDSHVTPDQVDSSPTASASHADSAPIGGETHLYSVETSTVSCDIPLLRPASEENGSSIRTAQVVDSSVETQNITNIDLNSKLTQARCDSALSISGRNTTITPENVDATDWSNQPFPIGQASVGSSLKLTTDWSNCTRRVDIATAPLGSGLRNYTIKENRVSDAHLWEDTRDKDLLLSDAQVFYKVDRVQLPHTTKETLRSSKALGRSDSRDEKVAANRLPYFTPLELAEGQTYQVAVLSASDGPAKFSIQLACDSAVYHSMCSFLRTYSSYEKLGLFDPGTTCVAFSSDGHYYRAIIVRRDGAKTLVYIVDVGQQMLVNTEDVLELPKETHQHRMLSARVGLASLGSEALDDKKVERFMELVKDEILSCRVVTTYPTTVELRLRGVCLTELLKDPVKLTPVKTLNAPVMRLSEERASMVGNHSGADAKLMRAVSAPETGPTPTARHDIRRLRTAVTARNGRPRLPDSSGLLRAALRDIARPVQRSNPNGGGSKDFVRSTSSDVAAHSFENSAFLEVKAQHDVPAAIAEVEKALVVNHSAPSYDMQSFEPGANLDVVIASIESPSAFFVVLKDAQELSLPFERFLNSPGTVRTLEFLTSVKPETPCLYPSASSLFRRGLVVAVISQSEALVRAVDYGVEERVKSRALRKIPKEFAMIMPPRAIQCSLLGFEDVFYPPDVTQYFKEIAPLRVTLQMTVKKRNFSGYEVELQNKAHGEKFKAAVYEHSVVHPRECQLRNCTRQEVLSVLEKSILLFEEQIQLAASLGVDIIVLPEDGLYGWYFNRSTLLPFLEYIPDPKVESWVPCDEPDRYGYIGPSDLQTRFSCLAKELNMFIAMNIGDRQACYPEDPKCPADGGYNYNTNVLFDRTGKLIARYHKYNLFLGERFYWDQTEIAEVSFVDTELGRLGFITCFDALFRDPAVKLVEDHEVSTILFPTAWTNVYPLFPAVGFHSAWARGMEINFLSANARQPSVNRTGSGIYSTNGIVSYYHNDTEDVSGRLVVGDLEKNPKKRHPKVRWSQHALASSHPLSPSFSSPLFHDLFSFTVLDSTSGVKRVCNGEVCCEVAYEKAATSEVFALGAFDGLHVVEGQYYLEICVVLKCEGTVEQYSCGSETKASSTSFSSLALSGTFRTSYVFPEVVLDEVRFSPDSLMIQENGLLVLNDTSPFVTVALFGRNYEKDNALASTSPSLFFITSLSTAIMLQKY